jgi:hypothetical protein
MVKVRPTGRTLEWNGEELELEIQGPSRWWVAWVLDLLFGSMPVKLVRGGCGSLGTVKPCQPS